MFCLKTIWYRRHGYDPDVRAVDGIDNVGPPSDTVCDGCAKGKHKRGSFPPSAKRATEPLELIHTDLVGPMETSIGGYSYFAGFIDDYSGFGVQWPLKKKSDTLAAFNEFKAWAETQTGRKLKRFFTAAHYKVYDQYLDALTQFDEGAMKRFWEQHRRDIFKKGLCVHY